ncbi:ABC transporter permease [Candidatus Bipolaricaulota bacterium]|nr:ABC transporter permease [Candidatus Bipolaricaulota bacterium]
MWNKLSKFLEQIYPFVGLLILLVGLWQMLVVITNIQSYLLPSPVRVVQALGDMQWRWFYQAEATSIEIFGGFLLAASVGILLGITITWSNILRRAILPMLVFLNSLPKIALAPLFIIWLGYGIIPNIVIAFTTAFFPVVINTAAGVVEIDPNLINFAKSLRVPKWKRFFKIRIPNALPQIFAGLKTSATLAVIGAIVGEFVASSRGLAAVIMQAQGILATEAIFAALVWISVLGLGLYGLVALTEKIFMPWAQGIE